MGMKPSSRLLSILSLGLLALDTRATYGKPVTRVRSDFAKTNQPLSAEEIAKKKGFKEFTFDGRVYTAATRAKAEKLHKRYLIQLIKDNLNVTTT